MGRESSIEITHLCEGAHVLMSCLAQPSFKSTFDYPGYQPSLYCVLMISTHGIKHLTSVKKDSVIFCISMYISRHGANLQTAGCARAITMYSPTAAICGEAYMASTVLKNALPSGTKEAENAENIKKEVFTNCSRKRSHRFPLNKTALISSENKITHKLQ
jgi:hypothetical protein